MDIIFDPQMTIGDMYALENLTKRANAQMALELGSWKGLSTSIIARHVDMLYCVDTWKGAISTPILEKEAQQRDILKIFLDNMTALGIIHKVSPMLMDSRTASWIIRDRFLDMVFIDADHAYTSVMQDIQNWSSKVRCGGVLCGHDCEILWRDCTPDQQQTIENAGEMDFIPDFFDAGRGVHPGVVRAIRDTYDDRVTIEPESSIWWRVM